jgi:Mrp family chromosome partitioning ATPase
VHPLPPLESQIVDACSLASLQIGGPTLRSLGITSSVRQEGRTTVAMGMALVQRQDYGRSVLLLELDLETPIFARRFDLDAVPGISELVRGETALAKVTQPWTAGIDVVTAGAPAGRGDRLVTRLLTSDILANLGRAYDIVVADLPPILGCSFGRLASSPFERLVLVVRAGATPVTTVREATADLPAPPAVMLNGTRTALPRWLRKLTRA